MSFEKNQINLLQNTYCLKHGQNLWCKLIIKYSLFLIVGDKFVYHIIKLAIK